jgi:hypothetical protein
MSLSRKLQEQRAYLLSLDEQRARTYIIPFETTIAAVGRPLPIPWKAMTDYEVVVVGLGGFVEVDETQAAESTNAARVAVQVQSKPNGINLFDAQITLASIIGSHPFKGDLYRPELPWRINPSGSIEVQFEALAGWSPKAARRVGIHLHCYLEATKLMPSVEDYEGLLLAFYEKARVAAGVVRKLAGGK